MGNALTLSLDNPAQGHVSNATLSYSGGPASASLRPLPPVAYRNRFDSSTQVSTMRFAGWYYLSVSLSPKLKEFYGSEPIPFELAVQVKNKAEASPYEGDAGVFGVTDQDREVARKGKNAREAAQSGPMTVVAAAGIGTGSVLLLGLGVWTLLARRRAAVTPAPGSPAVGGHRPPRGR
ncbi:Secreted protein OS=Streptomyces griseus OX=1911 GN=NCTC13033_03077 PE=4 SV=1 [Streptomyces griseus subsp. griseus]